MRIALLTREYLPETAWGGIGRFYAAFAQGLNRSGHEVEVFTQGLEERPSIDDAGVTVHSVLPRFYLLGRPRGGELAGMLGRHIGVFALSLAAAIRKKWLERHRVKPFDIVEAHEHLGIGSLLGTRRPGVVHVERYHVAYDLLVRRGLEAWPHSSLVGRLEERSLAIADFRIATTRFIDEQTQQAFPGIPPADEIIPIANGIPTDDSPIPSTKERVIVFAGRLSEVKRPQLMARAFARLSKFAPSWRLEIAGADAPTPRGGTYWAEMQDLMGNAAAHCHYWGAVDRAQLFEIFGKASIVAAPSAFESFGLAALEAMTFGCVPVVSDATALPEIVGDTGAIFENGNEDRFVEALERMTNLPDAELRRMGERAAERSRRCFDPELLMKRNLDSYHAAIAAKGASYSG